LIILLVSLGAALPAYGGSRPPVREAEQAVETIKRLLARTDKPCRTDWRRIDATGYKGHWTVVVRVRHSRSGDGIARWFIGRGAPVARNPLARDLGRGCGYA
jgi:hypothetical protein